MANKNINILMKLTDKFTQPMLKATNATKAQTKAMHAAQLKAVTFVNKANTKFLNLAKSLGRVALSVTGIGTALSLVGLKQFASNAMEAANKQIEAETKLRNALGNVEAIASQGTAEIERANKALLETASNIQKIGVIGDEVTIAGMQQLASYQLTDKEITQLSNGMTDLLAKQKGLNATQEDAVTIAKQIGKAMQGQTTSLERAGVLFTEEEKKAIKVGDEQQRALIISQALERSVGGVNAELAKTPAGQIKQTQNAFGDMMEQIGKKLLPIKAEIYKFAGEYIPSIQKAALGLLDKLTPAVENALNYLRAHTDDIKAGIESFKGVLANIWKVVKPLLKFIVEHAGSIIKVIAGIAAAFAAFNIVMKIIAIVNAIRKVISIVRKVITFIKMARTAMAAASVASLGPIGLIIAAIAAIIVIIVLVVKNWDKIKAKVIEVANKIKTVLQPVINWIKTAFENVKTRVMAVWDDIKTKVSTTVQTIKDTVAKVKDAIIQGWDKVKSTIGSIFDAPLRAAKSLYEWVMKLIDKLKELKNLLSSGSLPTGGSSSGLVWHNATGTPYWKGGLTHINEGGRGEVVDLPSGTRIIPHDVAKKTVSNSPVINVNLTVSGNVIGNREFMEACGEYIASKTIGALGVV